MKIFLTSHHRKIFLFDITFKILEKYKLFRNSDNEREIQKAIDKFWHANPLIAPSPDIVANRIMKPLTFTPSPDNVASCIKRTINPLNFTPSPIVPFTRRNSFRGLEDSPVSRASNGQTTRECQTDISIPLDFDLEDLLSKHLPPPQHASTPKFKKFVIILSRAFIFTYFQVFIILGPNR